MNPWTAWRNSRAVGRFRRVQDRDLATMALEKEGRFAELAAELGVIADLYARETRVIDHLASVFNARIRRCGALVRAGQRAQATAEAAQLAELLQRIEGPNGPTQRTLSAVMAAAERESTPGEAVPRRSRQGPGEPDPDWRDLLANLADVLTRLPDRGMLKMHLLERPDETPYAQLWVQSPVLRAEVRGVGAGWEERMPSAGWEPPGALRMNWGRELILPAGRAEYEELAGCVVAAFRDAFGVPSPAELGSVGSVFGSDEALELPSLGLSPIVVQYYVGRDPADPQRVTAVLRRIQLRHDRVAQFLDRDGQWQPGGSIEREELGRLFDGAVPVNDAEARLIVDEWRRRSL